jgi:UDP:flavonoid glycosyltransferase YjiC (YdhE family)
VRVLVASTGNTGHFTPLVPLARACAAAGHEVRVAVPRSFEDEPRRAGFEVAAFDDPAPEELATVFEPLRRHLGDDPGAVFDPQAREESNRVMLREVFAGVDARAALPGMTRIVESWEPDLVLRETAELSSLAVAESRGVRHVHGAIGTVAMLQLMAKTFDGAVGPLEEAAGLTDGRLARSALAAPLVTSTPPTFDHTDGRSTEPVTVHRFRAPRSPEPENRPLPSWGDPEAPLVYVSFGSVAATMPYEGLFRDVVGSLGDVDARVLFTTGRAGSPDSLRPWPDNVHVEQWWPQTALMPRTAAVVGHGGFGTTMAALAAGVPQVVLPMFATDQWFNAERVHATGAGRFLEPGPDLAFRLPAVVAEVLADQGVRRAAGTLRAEIAALPGPEQVLPAVLGEG